MRVSICVLLIDGRGPVDAFLRERNVATSPRQTTCLELSLENCRIRCYFFRCHASGPPPNGERPLERQSCLRNVSTAFWAAFLASSTVVWTACFTLPAI